MTYLCEWGTAEDGCIRLASHALQIPVSTPRVNMFCGEHAGYFNPQYISPLDPTPSDGDYSTSWLEDGERVG